MNTPTLITATGVASLVISGTRAALLYLTVQNTSAADRWFVIFDAASLSSLAKHPPGLRSDRIGAGQTWRLLPVDSSSTMPFTNAILLASFASDLSPGSSKAGPLYIALSASDANVIAWSAALQ